MNTTQIIQFLEAMAEVIGNMVPAIQQGQALLSQNDPAQVHDSLIKVEAATAALRTQVDAALAKAAQG